MDAEREYQEAFQLAHNTVNNVLNPAHRLLCGLADKLNKDGHLKIARNVKDVADRMDTAHIDFMDEMERIR